VTTDNEIKKKRDMLEHIVLQTGISMSESRRVIDAALFYLHDAITDGHDVALHPLGRIRVIDRDTEAGPKRLNKLVLQKQGF
jgi:nucleoid DNA-binding protein